jgi:hypothetical protein
MNDEDASPALILEAGFNATLYVYGVFDNQSNWSSYAGWIADIQGSAFNILVFSTFHVDPNGNLYGSVPLVTNGVFNPDGELNPDLPSLYQGLQQGKTLLYSIGNSAGTAGDMSNLQSILSDPSSTAYSNLQTNLGVLKSELGISGIDFDFEPNGYTTVQQGVVTSFTNFCNNLGLLVTYCPFVNEQWWVDAQIAAVTNGGTVACWNLQCYAGGFGNTPANWLSPIQDNAAAMGVSNPATFIVPGTDTSQTPQATQAVFAAWAAGAPGLNGGFIWQFGVIESESSVDDYANAVVNGIANPS